MAGASSAGESDAGAIVVASGVGEGVFGEDVVVVRVDGEGVGANIGDSSGTTKVGARNDPPNPIVGVDDGASEGSSLFLLLLGPLRGSKSKGRTSNPSN